MLEHGLVIFAWVREANILFMDENPPESCLPNLHVTLCQKPVAYVVADVQVKSQISAQPSSHA